MSRENTPEQSDSLDIPADIWDQAVREVDGECGYALEFAPDSIVHRLAYRERAEEIIDNLCQPPLEETRS